ncbi:MAG: ABC transporter permease [Acidobacteria bacterium]|nr:ABC transporter permease [Acidobacteriota bacterium]
MIGTVMWLSWTNLKRDRVALFLTFLLPLIFFSIFAMIFGNTGGGGGGGVKTLKVLAVDLDGTAISRALIEALAGQNGLTVARNPEPSEGKPTPAPWSRDGAYREVRGGRAAAAVVIPPGFGDRYGDFGQPGAAIEVIFDASNPMAQFTVSGLLQAAAFQAAPAVLMERGLAMLDNYGGGGLTERQSAAIANVAQLIESSGGGAAGGADGPGGLVTVEVTAAHDEADDGDQRFSMVAYYAAGIGVMFLLFSMSGAAGTLLDDMESGTLDRLLSTNLEMAQLLGGKWLFFSLIGVAQVVVMFVWGALAFGLDLFTAKRLLGFAVMAVATGAAASAFGIMLATICRSRAQLGGVSTIVILIMSALGGSMVPRFVMPEFMDIVAKFTFNGWALDGFLKVFWYDDPQAGALQGALGLAPEVGVLSGACLVFLSLARRLARRWERA